MADTSTPGQQAINGERLWGLWMQTSDAGYRQWVQDVSRTLTWSEKARTLWYLSTEHTEGLELLKATSMNGELGARVTATVTLGEVGAFDQAHTETVIVVLSSLLTDEAWEVRAATVRALGQVWTANPELVSNEDVKTLLPLLQDKELGVRQDAAATLERLVAAKPSLASSELALALIPLLDDDNWSVRESAMIALRQVITVQPQVASADLVAAVKLWLTDDEGSMHANAAWALGLVVEANPKLSKVDMVAILMPLLVNNDKDVLSNAAWALGSMIEANPELSTSDLVHPSQVKHSIHLSNPSV
jgi:HEAT repeat protein